MLYVSVDLSIFKGISNRLAVLIKKEDWDAQNELQILKNGCISEYSDGNPACTIWLTAKQDITERQMQKSARLHIGNGSVYSQLPIKLIDAGLRTLIVPIVSLETIIRIEPDINHLNDFCVDNEIDIIAVFTKKTAKMENDYRVRVFAPRFGYLEDPATGSGNSALGYYLMDNNMWDKGMLRLEQNNSMERFNLIQLQRKEDSNKNQRVLFGGGAIKRIEGEYHLYTE